MKEYIVHNHGERYAKGRMECISCIYIQSKFVRNLGKQII